MINDVMTAFVDEDADEQAQVEAIQRMISAGVWGLEGHTGRTMDAFIEAGLCVLGPTSARTYWGSFIPSRSQVKSGTKGSIAYANNLRRERGQKLITGSYLRRVERGVGERG